MKDNKANIIKANYRLQQKVGMGKIEAGTVKDMQNVIDDNKVDFSPVGLGILKKLEAALTEAAVSPDTKMIKESFTAPVMELKANAGIFHYALIGNLANIMLSFLEAIKTVDKDAIDIVQAHHDTIRVIIMRSMKGDGGDAGKKLSLELEQACQRYYNKKFAK